MITSLITASNEELSDKINKLNEEEILLPDSKLKD